MFSCLLVMLLSISVITNNIQTGFAQGNSRSFTFHSILFLGIRDGKPIINDTTLTLNGTDAQLRQQIPSTVDKVYNKALELTTGPAVFLGPTLNKTSIILSPMKADLTTYIQSVINKTASPAGDDSCWFFWLGGGSMHGDCPKEQ